MTNILLTSAGRRSYLVKYFQSALNGNGLVHVANSTAQNPTFRIADKYTVTPLIYSDNYIPFLLNYCKLNDITVLIPLFDADLPVLSSSRKLFAENGIYVLVSNSHVVDLCRDKWKTACFLKRNNIGHPETFLDLNSAITALEAGNLKFPVVVKPRRGMGSISIYEADNIDELVIFYKKAENTIKNSYIHYESKLDNNCVIIQQKLNGVEYHLDIINDLNGNYQNTIVKRKLAMRAGETDCAEIVEHEELWSIGCHLSELIKHKIILDVDVFHSENFFYVIEMNARFGGGYPFSHVAGVNLPKAIVQWLSGFDVNKQALLSATPGVIAHKDIQLVTIDTDIS